MAGAIAAPLHLILPVALLMTISAAAFLYADTPVVWFGAATAQWLTLGHLMLPLTFLAIHITNRRYGAGYAVAQVVIAWAFGMAAMWSVRADLPIIANRTLPEPREMMAFAGALFLAQIVSVAVFDSVRGPRWWQAPLFASLWGGAILSVIAFPAAYMGTPVDWAGHMFVYLGVSIGAAFAMVVPYWAIRGIVPPLSGFGGY